MKHIAKTIAAGAIASAALLGATAPANAAETIRCSHQLPPLALRLTS